MVNNEIPDIDLKQTVEEGRKEALDERIENIHKNMEKIKHKIVIISGKGGVGKTTVAVNLAISLVSVGLRVGLLDVDITGPNVVKMLGVNPEVRPQVDPEAKKFYPVNGPLNLKVMSMAFLTLNPDEPVIWRGPMKMGAV
ncbi:MAG: P-loop NTPase, partial [Candidatus Hodarchaeota archaeon]